MKKPLLLFLIIITSSICAQKSVNREKETGGFFISPYLDVSGGLGYNTSSFMSAYADRYNSHRSASASKLEAPKFHYGYSVKAGIGIRPLLIDLFYSIQIGKTSSGPDPLALGDGGLDLNIGVGTYGLGLAYFIPKTDGLLTLSLAQTLVAYSVTKKATNLPEIKGNSDNRFLTLTVGYKHFFFTAAATGFMGLYIHPQYDLTLTKGEFKNFYQDTGISPGSSPDDYKGGFDGFRINAGVFLLIPGCF